VDTASVAFPYGAPVKPVGAVETKPTATTTAASTTSLAKKRLDPNKCANPFQTDARKCKSLFSQSYVSGSIPCRLQSTASRHYLQWDEYAQSGFSPDLFVVCLDGLTEEQHPFTLMAPMMIEELVSRAEGNASLFVPVLDSIVTHLRKALSAEHSFSKGLRALSLVLGSTDAMMLPYLVKIVPCLTKGLRDRDHRDDVLAVLGLMEQQCGPEARKVIKAKIPTY
jgi:hypothetical protein